jgi:hypothetical protein
VTSRRDEGLPGLWTQQTLRDALQEYFATSPRRHGNRGRMSVQRALNFAGDKHIQAAHSIVTVLRGGKVLDTIHTQRSPVYRPGL